MTSNGRYAEHIKRSVRQAYCFKRLPIEEAASLYGVPKSTAQKWRKQGEKMGDDWDKVRAAASMASDTHDHLAQQLLHDYLMQHQSTLELIAGNPDLTPMEKAGVLASLADSFNKTIGAVRRLLPEVNRLAVGMEVITALSEFIRTDYPQHLDKFVEILEPFGRKLEALMEQRK